MKIKRSLILDLIWIQCFIYQCFQHICASNARCSWGSWLQWDCTCCGNYFERDVYRVRAKCCNNTYECAIVRAMAVNISDENAFGETGKCSKKCHKEYNSYNDPNCVSHNIDLNDLNMSSKIVSCTQDTCIGTLTTTTAKPTTTTTITTQTTSLSSSKSTSTPNPPPTIQASRTTLTSTVSVSVSSNTILCSVGNVKSSDTNYAVIFGAIFGVIAVVVVVVVVAKIIRYCISKDNKVNNKTHEQTEAEPKSDE